MSDIDYENVVDEIVESREGRNKWTFVDDDFRVWDAIVIGDQIQTTCADLLEIGKVIFIENPPQ
jgi:hypothetical protein